MNDQRIKQINDTIKRATESFSKIGGLMKPIIASIESGFRSLQLHKPADHE